MTVQIYNIRTPVVKSPEHFFFFFLATSPIFVYFCPCKPIRFNSYG